MQPLPIQLPSTSTRIAPEYTNVERREHPAFSLFKRIHKKENESISLNSNDLAILNEHLCDLLRPCQLNVGKTNLACSFSFAELFESLHAKAKQLGVELKLYLCISEIAYLLGFENLHKKLEEKNINIEKVCGTAYLDTLKLSLEAKPRYFTIHIALSLADKKTLTCLQDVFVRHIGQKISISKKEQRQTILKHLLPSDPQQCDWAKETIDDTRLQFYAADELAITKQISSKDAKNNRQLRIVLENTEGVTINFVFAQQEPRTCRVRNFRIPFGIEKNLLAVDLAEISLAPIIDKVCLVSTPLINPLKKENYHPLIKDVKNLIISIARGETCHIPGLEESLVSLFFSKATIKRERKRSHVEIIAYHLNKALTRMVQEEPRGKENKPYAAFALTLAACELFQKHLASEDLKKVIAKMMVHWSGFLHDQSLPFLLSKVLKTEVSYRLLSAIMHLAMLKELHAPLSTSLTIYKNERGHRSTLYAKEEILQLEIVAPSQAKYYFSVAPNVQESIKEIFHCSVDSSQNEMIDQLFDSIFNQKTSFQDFWSRIACPGIANALEPIFNYVTQQFRMHANDDHCQRCLGWFCCLAQSFLPESTLLINFVAKEGRQDNLMALYTILGNCSLPTLNVLVYHALKNESDPSIQWFMAKALCKGNPRFALDAFSHLSKKEKISPQLRAQFIDAFCEGLHSNEESLYLLEELIPYFETLEQAPLKHALWLANEYINTGQFHAAQLLLPLIKKSERTQVSKRLDGEKLEPLLAFAGLKKKELPLCDMYFLLAKQILKQKSSKKFSYLAQLFQFPETANFFASRPQEWWNEIIFPTLAQLSKASSRDRYLAGLICLGAFKTHPPDKNRFPELLTALQLVFANLSASSISSYLKEALLENFPILLKGFEHSKDVLEAAVFLNGLGFEFPKESLATITKAMIADASHLHVKSLLLVIYRHPLTEECKPNLQTLYPILVEQALQADQIDEAFELLQHFVPPDEIVVKFMAACVKHNKKHFFEWVSTHIDVQSLTQAWKNSFYSLYSSRDIPSLLRLVETTAFAKIGISSKNANKLTFELFLISTLSPHYFQSLHIVIKFLPYLQNHAALVKEFFSRLTYCDVAFKKQCWEQLKKLNLLPFDSKIICWQSLFLCLRGSSAQFFREVFEKPHQFPLLDAKNKDKAQAVEILFQEIGKRKIAPSLLASIKKFYAHLEHEAIKGTTHLNYAKILIAHKDPRGIEVLLASLKSWFQEHKEWPDSHVKLVENVLVNFSKQPEQLKPFISILYKYPHPLLGLHLVNSLKDHLQIDKANLLILLQETIKSSQVTQNHRLHLEFHLLFSKLHLRDFYQECSNSSVTKYRIQSLWYLSSEEVKAMFGGRWIATQLKKSYPLFFTNLIEDPLLPKEAWICALSGLTFLKGDQNFATYFKTTCDLLLRQVITGPLESQWTVMKELHRVVPLWSESTNRSLYFNQRYFDLVYASLEAAIYYSGSSIDTFMLEITKTLRQSFSNPNLYSKEFTDCVGFCSMYLFNRLLTGEHSDEVEKILDDFNAVRKSKEFRKFSPEFMLAIDLCMEAQNFLHKKITERPQITEFLSSRDGDIISFAISKMRLSINSMHFAIFYISSITRCLPVSAEDIDNPSFVKTLNTLEHLVSNLHQLKGPLYSLFMQKIISCFLHLQTSTLKNLEEYKKTDGVTLACYIASDVIKWRQKRDKKFEKTVKLHITQITDPGLCPNGSSKKLENAFQDFALVQENLLQLISSTIKMRIASAIKATISLFFQNLDASGTSTSEISTLAHIPDLIISLSKEASIIPEEIAGYINKFLDNLAKSIQSIPYIPSVFREASSDFYRIIVELITRPEIVHKKECLERLVNILEETSRARKIVEFHQAAEYVLSLAKEKDIVIHQASTSGSPFKRNKRKTSRRK